MFLFTCGSAKVWWRCYISKPRHLGQIYENLVVSVENIHVPIGCIYLRSTTYSNNSILHRHEFKMMGKRSHKIDQTLIHGDLTGWKVEKTPFNTSNKKYQCGTPLKRDCLVWYGMVWYGIAWKPNSWHVIGASWSIPWCTWKIWAIFLENLHLPPSTVPSKKVQEPRIAPSTACQCHMMSYAQNHTKYCMNKKIMSKWITYLWTPKPWKMKELNR